MRPSFRSSKLQARLDRETRPFEHVDALVGNIIHTRAQVFLDALSVAFMLDASTESLDLFGYQAVKSVNLSRVAACLWLIFTILLG